eukprot:g1672.t1
MASPLVRTRGVFRRLIVMVKQTAFEKYSMMKNNGEAPLAVRWDRLKDRHDSHMEAVDSLRDVLLSFDAEVQFMPRDEMHKTLVTDKDLVISVGGDGTCLSASHYVDDTLPLLAINSDPTKAEEKGLEMRRSVGALCACTRHDMKE